MSSLFGVLGDQVDRLLRRKWKSPVELSQELYAMFMAINQTAGQTQPIGFNANPNDAQPAMSFHGFASNQPFFQVRQPNGSMIAFTPSGITSDGVLIPGLEFPSPSNDGLYGQASPARSQNQKPKQGGGGDAGTIVSGSGTSYQVKLISGKTVSVAQGTLDPTDTIPVGTFVLVAQVSGNYYMQVPVWL